ncbi:MAG: hypothetical protein HY962_16755 [Ignavibacteriae bacterium]|nr:hypothetical protein [Ignavibacteriota bacterium]
MKLLSSDEAAAVLRPTLRGARGRFTVADASAASGLAIEDARTALDALMNQYQCRLQVTESGEILYDFGTSLHRRGEKSTSEKLRDAGLLLWKTFTWLFKIWITVMLIVYLIVFTLLLLAMIFGGRSDSKKGGGLRFIGDLFGDLFSLAARGMILVDMSDRHGYRHKAYRQAERANPQTPEQKKRLVQSVYDFVFGPPRPVFDPFAQEKEIVAWLRSQKGVLTVTEIVALAGWTYEEAEQRLADYLTRFKGSADITDDGVLVGRFLDVLRKGDDAMKGGSVELFWDEYEAPYEMTGNSGGRDFFIGAVNAFNLLFSMSIVFSSGMQESILSIIEDEFFGTAGFVTVALGWIPFIFSVIFFLVPLGRAIVVRTQERARLERNKRRRIVRAVFEAGGSARTLDELCASVNRPGLAVMDRTEIERLLNRALTELHGDLVLRDDGTPLYRFPRIETETAAARAERTRFYERTDLGGVVFDTGG